VGRASETADGSRRPLRKTIRVEEQLVEVDGKVAFGHPKIRAGRRTMTVPEDINGMLAGHMASPAVQSSGSVFPTPTGRLMRRSNFRKLWQRTVAAADVEDGPTRPAGVP
jgi:hypothetical protein